MKYFKINICKKGLLFIIFIYLFIPNYVGAKSYATAPNSFTYKYLSNGSFCSNRSSGEIYNRNSSGGCNGGIAEKAKYATFGGQNNAIYCSEWNKSIDSETKKYKKYEESTWDPNSKRAVVSGAISYYLNENNKLERNIYAKVGVAINHYLATSAHPLAGSHKFSSLQATYSNIIKKAEKYYDDNKSDMKVKKLPTPTFSPKSMQLSYSSSSSEYKSGTITVSGLVTKKYNANINYTISVSTNNSNAMVRLGTSGNFSNSIENKNITSNIANDKYSFVLYVKGTNIANTKITVTINSSNSSSYYTSYLYYSSKYGASRQRLIYPGVINVSRSGKGKITAVVPDINKYSLYVTKVNEDGETLDNASFKASYNGTNINLTAQNGIYSWNSGDTTSTYDFSKFKLTEIKAPNGYIYTDGDITFDAVSAGETCIDNTNGNEVNTSFCHLIDDYTYKCKNSSDGSLSDPDDQGNCVAPASENPAGEGPSTSSGDSNGDSGTSSGDSGTSSGNTGTGEGGNDGDSTSSQEVNYTKVCIKKSNNSEVDDSNCNPDETAKYVLFKLDGKSLTVTVVNKKNTVTISKRAITGDDEVAGAELKICTSTSYKQKSVNCDVATDVDNNKLTWVSGDTPYTVTGLVPGDYAIVETIAPYGYEKLSQAVEFSIDSSGKVTGKTVAKVVSEGGSDDIVIVNNKITSISISKTDVATSKELPGATLSICRAITELKDNSDDDSNDSSNEVVTSEEGEEEDTSASEDKSDFENKNMVVDKNTGECIPVVLADGTRATWVSGNEAKPITGLPAGTYYLVEKIAPFGYSTAESILFKLNDDGTLTDKDGKSLTGNKLVMKDAHIKDVKTGMLPIIIISLLGVGSIGGVVYYLHKSSYKKLPRRKK